MSRTPAEAAAVAAVTHSDPANSADGHPADDGEPSHPDPAEPLYVPVRPCSCGFALRVYRTPLGTRTAVAFTSRRRLSDCLGPGVPSVRLALPAVRALAEPLGVTLVRVDPQLSAAPVRPFPEDTTPLQPTLPG
ncbi:SAV_915 family protein [Streptomyces sichuanensis]|uniref:SAV_915 family protein n=1 Tax=Streptomyces sichuanensis TaxID=2871810 RepID=UPI0027E0BE40|nr:SAV_915 family protein [Streptomyces sichuanensis]